MVNAKFNTDEHLNEILNVDRHMDHHPGGLWLAEHDGWYDGSDDENDMDEENDSDDSEESWDDPNRRVQILDKDGRVDKEENDDVENGSDDDNDLVAEEE